MKNLDFTFVCLPNGAAGISRMIRNSAFLLLTMAFLLAPHFAAADTMPILYRSFAGNVNFIGAQRTLRTAPNSTNACSVVSGSTTASGSAATTATLSGLPDGATIKAAYLYWAGSSSTPDYDVTFESTAYSATRRFTATNAGLPFFSGVADVTAKVQAKGNGTYSFSGLTINASSTYCNNETVLGGWALLVVYSHSSEEFRVLNLYEGFQAFQNSSITLNLSNFSIPSPFGEGKIGHITWEGDPTLSGGGENLSFNNNIMTDGNNPTGNQFNSVSTITGTANSASYGIDFDAYPLKSPVIQAGQTTATTTYATGQDLVLLSAEIIAVPNKPVADLGLTMARGAALIPGQTATYTLTATNFGPNSEPGPITITDTLPSGMTYSSFTGTGWSCSASGQTVTCTRTGNLASGASAPALALTVNVASNVTGTKTNTATVAGTSFDNVSSNNTATDSYTITADLALTMMRNSALSPGQSASYTLNISNTGPNAETGTITVTDTLPAGVSFTSYTGTGWVCNAVGQTVTCTNSGVLASGSSAPALTLAVAVAANATGAKTNTATVAGTAGMDNNTANNTASDSFTVAADLSLAMTRTTSPLVAGQPASYTLTVSNGGPSTEPGSIKVIDTLPTGLTYASFSGAGWSCTVSGQTVTCIRSGSLASGSASSVFLTVNVAANATGVITNIATVSGTSGLDNDTSNNTASNAFIFAEYAYYAMDENSWGSVLDSSGNNRNGSKLGTAAPTGYTANGAMTGNPGTCGSGLIPASTGSQGVATPVNISNIGNAGTIAFWYRGNAAWDDGNDRMLFDASSELGNGNADKQFYLVKRYDGSLMFALEDSNDTNSTATTATAYTFAANTWHHIAVTWNIPADRVYIYLDGAVTPVASSTTNLNGSLGSASTLYLGTRKLSSLDGKANNYTANSANGYLDEVRILATALSGATIAALMDTTHACASPDHYELSLPSSSFTCLPATAKVTACADASNPCTNRFTAASGQTATLGTSGGALASSTVTFDANGEATTTLSYPTAVDGSGVSVTLSGESLAASNARKCCPDGVSCSTANSCTTTFNTAGFIFAGVRDGTAATIPTQVAGTTSGTVYLRAIKSNTTTKACETALTGTQTVDFAYECNNPDTCYAANLMSVNGGASTVISRNNNNIVASYTPVTLTFDADGNAGFTFNYGDVGSLSLWARKMVNDATLSGKTSNPFVVKPAGFVLSNIQTSEGGGNPGATDAFGPKFVRAGESFKATVKALTSTNGTAYSYGRESPAEGVKLTSSVKAGLGLNNTDNTEIGNFTSFTNGEATGSDFSWNEVGIITITPSVAGDGSYLGAGDVIGTPVENVGRFYAAKFELTGTQTLANRSDLCPAAANCPSGFTYMGESMSAAFTLAAQAVGGATLKNYAGAFAKLNPAAAVNAGTSGPLDVAGVNVDGTSRTVFPACAVAKAHPCITPGTATGGFANGEASVTLPVTIYRGATAVSPYTALKIGISPQDSDGAAMGTFNLDTNATESSDNKAKVVQANVRYGRLWLSNAHGSELLPLPVTATAQYWNGTAFVMSADDSITTFATGDVLRDNFKTLAAANVNLITSPASVVFSNGVGRFRLAAPGVGNTGSVDLDVTSLGDYLPTIKKARARFGVNRGSNRFIYMREMY